MLEHVEHVRRGQLWQILEPHVAQTGTHHTDQLFEPAASFFAECFGDTRFFCVRNDLAQGLQLLHFFAAAKGGIGPDSGHHFGDQRLAAKLLGQRNHIGLLGKSIQALGANQCVNAVVANQFVRNGLFQIFDVGVLIANDQHSAVREYCAAHNTVNRVNAICSHLVEQLDGHLPRSRGVHKLDVGRQLQAVNDFLRFGSIDHGV